jgi:hypothetical protein
LLPVISGNPKLPHASLSAGNCAPDLPENCVPMKNLSVQNL